MESTLLQADDLSRQGKWQEAIDLLSASNRRQPSVAIERKLVDLRLQAHSAMSWPTPNSHWAGEWETYPDDNPGIEEVDASEFCARAIARGVLGRGALIVRGLVSPEDAAELRACIDNTIKAREEADATDDSPWKYSSPYQKAKEGKFVGKDEAAKAKRAEVKKGSIWVVESPRAMQRLIDLYDNTGLKAVLTEYFAERPVLSAKKWVLRKIAPNAVEAGWHQDGQFMGTNFHSVNMWLSLSECGGDTEASGLEIMPTPIRKIHETGTRGAAFQWTVGKDVIEELAKDVPICVPRFSPGDALFFDHYNLHRTAFGPHLKKNRYAVESWFFAASSIPAKQAPIVY